MENQITLFEHEQFGKVRVVMIDGEPWFVGKDVAKSLGYKDHKNALKDHVDAEEKRGWQIATPYGVQNMTVINESGMYALIFGSKLEKAREFKHWVTSVVLPSIRKTGSYSLFAKPEPVVTLPEAIYRVYAILFKGGIVKTGCTKRLCTRMSEVKREFKREIERATKCEIVDIYFSPLMYCEDARLVERCCKEVFSSQLVKGEFFSAEFAEVCAAINRFVKFAAVQPLVTKHYIATKKSLVDKNSI